MPGLVLIRVGLPVMPRSHIHRLDAGLATDTIRHGNPYWSIAFCIASVNICSSTYTTITNFSMKYHSMCKVYTDVGGIK